MRDRDRTAPSWLYEPGTIPSEGPTDRAVLKELEAVAGSPPIPGNAVRFLADGSDSFSAMLDSVRHAARDVRLENFIFRADTVGRAFAHELRASAARGVQVSVLHDPVGAIMARRPPVDLLFRGSPVRVALFNVGWPTARRRRLGRDHRKLVVTDGREMIAGGICLADPWAGNCIRHCTWRDSAVQVRGPAANAGLIAFSEAWVHGWRSGPATPLPVPQTRQGHVGNIPVRVLANLGSHRPTREVLKRVIHAARRRVLITNPYLVPPADVVEALRAAARRGVEVSLLIPGVNNHRLVALSVERGLGALLESGCRLFLWGGAMLHAKSVVVDDSWSMIGSTNLDPLSLQRNAEFDVEVLGTEPARVVTEQFRRDCEASRRLEFSAWKSRPMTRRVGGYLASAFRRWQ